MHLVGYLPPYIQYIHAHGINILNVTDIKVNNGSLSIIIIMPHKLISSPTDWYR